MELFEKLGIDWKLLIAQIVNFLILLFVLKRFAYQPILKILNERKNKIEKGLEDAENSRKKLIEIIQKEKDILKKAREEAQMIIIKAEETAKRTEIEIISEAKMQAEKIIIEAKEKIEEEKKKMIIEAKKEVANLVFLAVEKVIAEKMNNSKDKEMIEKLLKN